MKKIFILFAVVGLFSLTGCTGDDGPPGQDALIPQAFEIQKSFTLDPDDGYIVTDPFSKYLGGDLYIDESVLIYRLAGTNSLGSDVWQLIPTTLFFSGGDELTYDYEFSKEGFTIFAGANYPLSETPAYLNNQVFRFVIIPSDLAASVNKKNYLEVMSAANLKESQVKNIKL